MTYIDIMLYCWHTREVKHVKMKGKDLLYAGQLMLDVLEIPHSVNNRLQTFFNATMRCKEEIHFNHVIGCNMFVKTVHSNIWELFNVFKNKIVKAHCKIWQRYSQMAESMRKSVKRPCKSFRIVD